MEQGRKLLVVDVQDAADVLTVGTIPGAVNISLGSLTYKADHGLPKEWRDFRLNNHGLVIITTCGMGTLGALGGKLLQDMGYTNVLRAVRAAGFEDVQIMHKHDNYQDVPDPSDALEFGTHGISFCARKKSRVSQ